MRAGRFVLAYLAGFAAFSAARHDRRVLAYLVVVGGLALVVGRVGRRDPFSAGLRWAMAGAGLLHMGGGLLPSPDPAAPVLYETWVLGGVLKYDQLVHFGTSAVVTFAAWHVLGRWVDDRCQPSTRALLAAVGALGFGAVNETFEFLSALRFADALVGGLENVGWDLVFNSAGALAAAVHLAVARARPRRERLTPA